MAEAYKSPFPQVSPSSFVTGAAMAPAPPRTDLAAVRNALNAAEILSGNVLALERALFGDFPLPDNASQKHEPAHGVIPHLDQRADVVSDALLQADRAVARIMSRLAP